MITFKHISPQDFIKPYSPTKPTKEVIDDFSKKIQEFLQEAERQNREEFQKNEINKLLTSVYNYKCNTKKDIDSVIYVENEAQVLIEAKSLKNKPEFPKDTPLSKALCETVLYFLRETLGESNNSIKHIILCNPCEFYIFDAQDFNIFSKDSQIKKFYNECDGKKGTDTSTKKFYESLEKYLRSNKFSEQLSYTYFSLNKELSTEELSAIYQLLSPQVLLKVRKTLDANTLNKDFYEELLYILGLEEEKREGKTFIIQSSTQGSLSDAILGRYPDLEWEEVFTLITAWNNRILFLRLLESMLLSCKHIQKDFLNISEIKNFSDLDLLFFGVLARKEENRLSSLSPALASIPYLNSSLFDRIPLEQKGKNISGLQSAEIKLFPRSILKERYKDKNELPLLRYLFEFLHAYDFTTTPKDIEEGVKKNHDKLINSAVLGLVFEKLNGYKEGSFYTPSFITTYMCKESITQAVIDKFNSVYEWKCKNLDKLKDKIAKEDQIDDEEFLNTLLSLRICDPAVGSGHFLVSALNEIVLIAHTLRIFPLPRGMSLEVENDEIIIRDRKGIIAYHKPETQNEDEHIVQTEMFNLKKSIIENCLFGVDINPNSCEITKLRLWIELLKYSYYIFDENGKNTNALETLPNIDINIKCGNSLISYFKVDDDFPPIKNIQEQINQYKHLVKCYKEGRYEDKDVIDNKILEIQESFKNSFIAKQNTKEINAFIRKCNKYSDNYGHYLTKEDEELRRYVSGRFFLPNIDENKARRDFRTLKREYRKIFSLEEYKPFEWRFAFPEVLDDDGNFLGFDAVIGNPPYVYITKDKSEYRRYKWKSDLYLMFFEKGLELTRDDGFLSYITPKFYLVNENCSDIRDFMINEVELISLSESNPFEVPITENIITFVKKCKPTQEAIWHYKESNEVFFKIRKIDKSIFLKNKRSEIILSHTDDLINIFSSIEKNAVCLGGIIESKRGAEFGKQFIEKNRGNRKILVGEDVQAYNIQWNNTFVDTSLGEIQRLQEFFDTKNLIFLRRVDKRLTASISNENFAFIKNIYGISVTNPQYSYKFILGLLNSKLLNFYYLKKFTTKKEKVFPEIQTYLYNQLPIRKLNSANQPLANKIIPLVEKILKKKEQNPQADTQKLEAQIDSLVYELYNLTDEEIEIVQGEQH